MDDEERLYLCYILPSLLAEVSVASSMLLVKVLPNYVQSLLIMPTSILQHVTQRNIHTFEVNII